MKCNLKKYDATLEKKLKNIGADFSLLIHKSSVTVNYKGDSNTFLSKSRAINSNSTLYMFSLVKRNFTNYIIKNNFKLRTLKAKNRGVYTNNELAKKSIGKSMYLVDVKSCYWQVSYKKFGYITEKTYKRALDKKFKLVRNMALASVSTGKRKVYYKRGVEVLDIAENVDIYKQMYSNVRFYTYNLFEDIMREIGKKDNVLRYRTDGIIVRTKKQAETVQRILLENELEHTIETIKVISAKQFFNPAKNKNILL